MSQKLELPDELYSALVKAAKDTGVTPLDWIADKLPKPPVILSDEERRADDLRLEQHTVSLQSAASRSQWPVIEHRAELVLCLLTDK